MCLSTAYRDSKNADNIIAKNITRITFDGDDVVLTDLMDDDFRVTGTLKLADLVNGYVIIDTEEVAA
ncbi:MAG: CooT family nickel-binding protein [Oscillospiraceae bacterium]|jgi:predicted RNA-binding protein|nr:CooT family nickel-binding protein [Oscillospiraceae bacterium]